MRDVRVCVRITFSFQFLLRFSAPHLSCFRFIGTPLGFETHLCMYWMIVSLWAGLGGDLCRLRPYLYCGEQDPRRKKHPSTHYPRNFRHGGEQVAIVIVQVLILIAGL